MFIAALFVIAKKKKKHPQKPRCPSASEKLNYGTSVPWNTTCC